MTKFRSLIAFFALAPSLAFTEILISNGWVSEPIAGISTAAGYFTLTNGSDEALDIVAVSCELAEMCHMHLTIHDNGTAKMRKQTSINVPSRETIRFEPGGYHIMVMGLSPEFSSAESLGIRLLFADGSGIDTQLIKKSRRDGAHKHHHHQH